jgi:phosphoglycolate phosphatase
MPSATLLLFDIDGTLLRNAEKEHFDALPVAIERVYRLRGSEEVRVDIAGRTDVEIARLVLRGAGLDERAIDQGLRALKRAWADVYEDLCPDDLSDRRVPGMARLLSQLDAATTRLAVLSGNLEPIAVLKLERSGLLRFFNPIVGAFGSDAEVRGRLPGIARKRAGGEAAWPRDHTVLVGDTPRDIAAARAGGIRCVGVATGVHSVEDLSGADRVAADAGELELILAELISGRRTTIGGSSTAV